MIFSIILSCNDEELIKKLIEISIDSNASALAIHASKVMKN